MPVKIRLQRQGRKKQPFYHIVVSDSRTPRDGKFIERIGSYNPQTVPATIEVDVNKAVEWMDKGAQPSDTARRILSYKGVLYKRHLLRGVAKGVVAADQVDVKWNEYLAAHTTEIAAKKEQHNKHKEAKVVTRVAKKVAAEVVVEEVAPEAPVAEAAPAVEVAPVAETPAVEAAPEAPAAE